MPDRTRDEAALSRYFKRKVEAAGALTYIGDRARGWPDYLVFWPLSKIAQREPNVLQTIKHIELVELKDPLGHLEPMQKIVHDRLRSRGHRVHVLTGREQVDQWLKLRGVI